MRQVPHSLVGLSAASWAPFLQRLEAIPRHSSIHWVVRGWDGLSTAQAGLRNFIQAYASTYQNQYQFNFEWLFVQMRDTTNTGIITCFGRPVHWNPPAPGTFSAVLETALGMRVHPPLSHQRYMNTLLHYQAHFGNPIMRNQYHALALLYVFDCIDRGKSVGNASMYNHGRNNIP